MARLQLQNVTKRYGDFHAVRDVTLDVPDGEFLVLLGPSGCGKTTTLRIIAGFVEATAGIVLLGGRDVTTLPPWKRNAGLVFQNYALFPHLTVAENVAFGLEMRKVPKPEIAPRVAEALRLVRLGHLGERLPRQLSGGQQQRVALARALVFKPDVLLLDEPLSNLDAKLRQEVRIEIRQLTAPARADDHHGHARPGGSPDDGRPPRGDERRLRASARHATGSVRAPGRSVRGRLRGAIDVPRRRGGDVGQVPHRRRPGHQVSEWLGRTGSLALRPERISLGTEPLPGLDNQLSGVVDFVSYLGAEYRRARPAAVQGAGHRADPEPRGRT